MKDIRVVHPVPRKFAKTLRLIKDNFGATQLALSFNGVGYPGI
jgi:hypothetical protein